MLSGSSKNIPDLRMIVRYGQNTKRPNPSSLRETFQITIRVRRYCNARRRWNSEFSSALILLNNDDVDCTKSTVDTPETDGLAERTHQTIMNDVSSCLVQENISERYYHYALCHVVATRNTAPHSLVGEIPFIFVFGMMIPYLEHIRSFGCRVNYQLQL